MANILIGTMQNMQVTDKNEEGWVLKNKFGKALLLSEKIDASLQEDVQTVDVFLYKGNDGQALATMNLPEMQVDTFGWGIVQAFDPHLGAFVDIGTDFNVLLPKGDLPAVETAWPEIGNHVYLRLKKDSKDRLLTIPAKEHELNDLFVDASAAALNDSIKGRIVRAGREGSLVMTEEGFRGFIHHSERRKEPRLGEIVSGRIIEVKEDGTLNISLHPLKQDRIDDDAEKIFAYIEANDGTIPIGNKSDAALIENTFGLSKSAFKRAVGRLLKQGKIKPEDEQIVQLKK